MCQCQNKKRATLNYNDPNMKKLIDRENKRRDAHLSRIYGRSNGQVTSQRGSRLVAEEAQWRKWRERTRCIVLLASESARRENNLRIALRLLRVTSTKALRREACITSYETARELHNRCKPKRNVTSTQSSLSKPEWIN